MTQEVLTIKDSIFDVQNMMESMMSKKYNKDSFDLLSDNLEQQIEEIDSKLYDLKINYGKSINEKDIELLGNSLGSTWGFYENEFKNFQIENSNNSLLNEDFIANNNLTTLDIVDEKWKVGENSFDIETFHSYQIKDENYSNYIADVSLIKISDKDNSFYGIYDGGDSQEIVIAISKNKDEILENWNSLVSNLRANELNDDSYELVDSVYNLTKDKHSDSSSSSKLDALMDEEFIPKDKNESSNKNKHR